MNGFALEDIKTHRCLQVSDIRFNAPPRQKKIGDVFDAVALGIDQGGKRGHGLDAKVFWVHLVAAFSHLQALGKRRIWLWCHPLGDRGGFEPVDALVLVTERFDPT